jgi:uncharacterized protein YjbI with pentapeptide repeats
MKIVKPLTLGALTRSYLIGGERRFVVSALGFFPLAQPAARFALENLQWPGVLKALKDQGIAEPLDEVLPKSRAELLLTGHAHAPHGKPVARMQASLAAAGIEKTIDVIGERAWRYDPWLRIDAPKPFASMPLGYANAFGGPRHPDNPGGRGYDRNCLAAFVGANSGPMPNLETPGRPVRRHWKRYAPAGFGPLAFDSRSRTRHAGRYGAKWLAHEAPGFASSASPELFQRAPADQRLDGYLQGGEPYRLTGMHAERFVIEGALPRFAARAFVQRKGAAALEPLALNFDTVWFFPDLMLGLALYHGETPHAHPLGFDIEAVMLAYERVGAPRPLAHYTEVYARRTDPETAAAHLFNDSDLAADYDAATVAARADASAARAAQAAAQQAERRAAQLAEFEAVTGARLPAMEPGAAPAPLTVPDGASLDESDFTLEPTLASARQMIADARAQADQLRAAVPLPAAPAGADDTAERREAALARASEPAADLAASGGPDAASPATPDSGMPAQQRAARRARLGYTDPDGPLAPELARWLGQQVEQWHRAGVLLAGRDLAGIDLSGVDLSGADLREVQLENADLRHARLAGAQLDRAVLSGAQLDGADFSHASLRDANLCGSRGAGIRFAGADLSLAWALDAQWPGADLSSANLERCLASGIGLAGACLARASAAQAVLMNASAAASEWREAQLSATVLMRADLRGAVFAGATLRKTVLMDATLTQAVFDGATLVDVVAGGASADWSGARLVELRAEHCSWQQACLRGSDWRGAALAACDLGRSDLSQADLSDANLGGCLFTAATFALARLERANLFRAVCRAADFTGASLVGASLYQADTGDARFERADLRGVVYEAGRRAAA